MSRAAHTIGVAIAVPEPYGAELTKWRETLGDPLALAIPPHVTLITPMQVDDDQLALVIDHLDLVASGQWAFDIQLRGTGSFRPVSPVVFVALAAGISDCERVEQAVRSGPLFHPLKFNYHPHVTVAHDVPPDVLDRAFDELADYEALFAVLGFGLFERGDDGVWRTEREFPFRSSSPSA
ncbi:MAG TPA: 2'-5' RNA ligase family protein [Acidothermaceae bacterium]